MGFKALVQQGIDWTKQKISGKPPSSTSDSKTNSVYGLIQEAANSIPSANDSGPFYKVSAKDWYQTYPYRFKIKHGDKVTYYSLPIPPEALGYQMVSTSQLIPTLGGVVEETSATVFWQITLSGTTGIAIGRRYSEEKDQLDLPASQEQNFRKILKGGILANTFNKAANVFNAVTGVAAAGYSASGMLGILEGLASTAQRFNASAVKTNLAPSDAGQKVADMLNIDLSPVRGGDSATNGYVEIHLLHNFLNAYSYLKEKNPETTELFFESHKDNMQWQVIVKAFSFQKNAAQPYLYRYNIALQGFDLKEVGAEGRVAIDRFGPDGDLGGVNSFTLSGAMERSQSLFRKISTNPLGLIASKPPII